MDTITSIEKIDTIKESVVTIGNFDGLHRGHQVLIKKATEYAKANNISSVVFTFKNHPVNYFRPGSIKNIITSEEKIKILKSMGVDYVINIPFDEYMTKISGYDFVKDILLDKLNVKNVIVGHDFTFARNKEGNVKLLQELSKQYGFSLEIVNSIKLGDVRISSTYIRKLILDGSVEDIYKYLGRNYKLSGEVIHSKKLGRTIGFPTANISINKKENNMIKKVWNIITTIVVILVILLACIFFVPRLFGITPMAVLSGSMEPTYHVGGLVFVQKVDPSDVEVGDSITFTIGNDTVVTHRVIEVNKEEQSFKTKGDANDNEDGGSVAFNNVKGRALGFTIPYLGFLAVYLNSTSGIIILVAFILIMMLLSFIVDQLSKDDKEKK